MRSRVPQVEGPLFESPEDMLAHALGGAEPDVAYAGGQMPQRAPAALPAGDVDTETLALGAIDQAVQELRAIHTLLDRRGPGGLDETLIASAVNVAPAAGQTLVQIPAPLAGVYEVKLYAGVSNAAAADLANIELRRNGDKVISPLPAGANGESDDTVIPRLKLSGQQSIELRAIGAGTAAIEYATTIIATRVA